MPASALTATDGANYCQWSLSCCEPKMSDLWPEENEKEAFQLGLSPVLYCSVTKIVVRCEHLFHVCDGRGEHRAWEGDCEPQAYYTAMLNAKHMLAKGEAGHYQAWPFLPAPFPENKRLTVNHPRIWTKANENIPPTHDFCGTLYTPASINVLFD